MKKKDKYEVVIDTNLVISGTIAPGSLPDQILTAWEKRDFIWVISDEISEEIGEVIQRDHIRKKYRLSDKRIAQITLGIKLGARFVVPSHKIHLHSRDIKDNKLLACAFAGDCDYLVSGDKDLLVLSNSPSLGKLQIVTARAFLDLLRAE